MKFIHSRSQIAIGAGAILLAGTAWAGCAYVFAEPMSAKTQDAYVTADYTLVAPKVAGLIETVLVDDNQAVKAGQLLVKIDDRDFRSALASAEADVEAAKADISNLDAEMARQPALVAQAAASVRSDQAAVVFAHANAARYRNLSTDGAGTQQENQQATAQLSQSLAATERDAAVLESTRRQLAVLQAGRSKAVAALSRAEAARSQAQLNLSYTDVRAPIDGFIGRRSARPGAYANVGSALLAVVPISQSYVIANFQESQVGRMRLDQAATITVDSFPGLKLKGHIDSLAPATDVAFAPIQPDNATGNFTKIVQRIPVKIVLEPGQGRAKLLRVGMSVIPTVELSGVGSAPVDTIASNR